MEDHELDRQFCGHTRGEDMHLSSLLTHASHVLVKLYM